VRILFVAEGIDRSEAGLLERLAGHGHGVELLVANPSDISALQQTGVKARHLPLRARYDIAGIRSIRQHILSERFDIVHCLRNNRPITNVLAAARGTSVRIVAYRGTTGHLSRLDPSSWLSYLSPRIDVIMCVSEAVRQYLLRTGVPADRTVTIYKGHDPAWYESTSPHDLSAFGIPTDAHVVCCAANMRRDKGVDVLVRSFHHLSKNSPVHLLLVGSIRDPRVREAAMDERIRHLVHCTGFRDDATHLIGASDIFVMPSLRREGLSRAVIEAMSQRVPPVVTDVGGMPELVEDGVSGRVVPPSDPVAMARAIDQLTADAELRRRLGEHARRRIEEQFSADRTLDSVIRMYESFRPECQVVG
jgi:glycosyltransferase involved in cell wall biosynthesis